ncbi:MAG TPA: type IV pilus twitching motility protein PilT [Firmicutes bacterium]|nr:type IV pilus twitching motility protein PilT [Bacillota bacterium]
MNISELLKLVVKEGASDLHLAVGAPPTMRVNGELARLGIPPLAPANTESFAREILTGEKYSQFEAKGELDVSYSYSGLGRFRVSVYHQRGTVGLVFRVISTEVPDLVTLGLPDVITKLTERSKGLIIVAGPARSGKSTTLAAMVNYINRQRQCHILTIENPIEYLHCHKEGLVNQREIGSDSLSFSSALKSALRQDPDVIMVSEMADPETVSTVITAAETEHLVMASMYAGDVPQALNRILELYPEHMHQHIRVQLANNLLGIIVQRLLPRKDDKGMIAAVEFLVVTPAIRNMIRQGQTEQIYTLMKSGAKPGMQSIDTHLKSLYEKGLIKAKDALENAGDWAAMSRHLAGPASYSEEESGGGFYA